MWRCSFLLSLLFASPVYAQIPTPDWNPPTTTTNALEIHGSVINFGNQPKIISWNGTVSNPLVLHCVDNVLYQGAYGAKLTLSGSYIIWDGCTFDNISITLNGNHIILRNTEIRNHNPAGNSSAVNSTGQNIIIENNKIHNNGDYQSPTEHDIHGIFLTIGASQVWIHDNIIYQNGGDGIQLGSASLPEPWPNHIYIYSNLIHEDRENAVDIKKSRDIIVYQNICYGYKETSSSAGEAIVTHDMPERVWIVNNVVASSVRGIVSSGASGYIVMGNIITNIRHNPNNVYDPTSMYASHAIITYDSLNVYHYNNTITNSDGGISLPTNFGNRYVDNNISLSDVQQIIGVTNEQLANFTIGDPMLDGNFKPLPGSPVLNNGISIPLYDAYKYLYKTSIDKTIYGDPRVNIGAL